MAAVALYAFEVILAWKATGAISRSNFNRNDAPPLTQGARRHGQDEEDSGPRGGGGGPRGPQGGRPLGHRHRHRSPVALNPVLPRLRKTGEATHFGFPCDRRRRRRRRRRGGRPRFPIGLFSTPAEAALFHWAKSWQENATQGPFWGMEA